MKVLDIKDGTKELEFFIGPIAKRLKTIDLPSNKPFTGYELAEFLIRKWEKEGVLHHKVLQEYFTGLYSPEVVLSAVQTETLRCCTELDKIQFKIIKTL